VPTIDRAGVSIHYEARGPANAPPILLSHGYGATSRMWDGQVAAFADRWRIVLWDMRGHGESGDPRDPALYSHALTVADMAAVLDACDIERAVIGGLSLGGVMSLAFHLAHPERVRCSTPAPASATPRRAGNGTSAPRRGPASSRKRGCRIRAEGPRRGSAGIARPRVSPARRAACWRSPTAH
jgi:pimeloyl-ACP methyl ester carboxylesterase